MDIEFITTNWYLFAALVVICGLIAVDTFSRGANTSQVTAVQLPQLINHDGAVVIDICESAEFENGHIPAAIIIPLGQLDSNLNRLKKYRDKKKPIVLTCKTGTKAGRAAAILRKIEFSDVYTLAGGLAAWEKENLPVER